MGSEQGWEAKPGCSPNVLQIVGYKDSGKTTLMEKLLRHCTVELKLRVATVKHHHQPMPDEPDTDTWRHRQAGAAASLLHSPGALRLQSSSPYTLEQLASVMEALESPDLIVAEGFKGAHYPKVVLLRSPEDFPLVSELSRIELLLFRLETDLQAYTRLADEGRLPDRPALLRDDRPGLLSWLETYLTYPTTKEREPMTEQRIDSGLTHMDPQGRARMVDISEKAETVRTAVACSRVCMSPDTLRLIREGRAGKGDVLAVAQVAGIMAAKKTAELIPMCHPIPLTGVDIRFEETAADMLEFTVTVKTTGRTGVEMEALTAAQVVGLTIYDMCKSKDKGMTLGPTFLLEKQGGKSGDYRREGI